MMRITEVIAGVYLLLCFGCTGGAGSIDSDHQFDSLDHRFMLGEWVRQGPEGPIGLMVSSEGLFAADFDFDKVPEVTSRVEVRADTLIFHDVEGERCGRPGKYRVQHGTYYLGFDLIEDDCPGRLSQMMGFWTRPDFRSVVSALNDSVILNPGPGIYLERARVYMAIARQDDARQDLDQLIEMDSTIAVAWVHRAATRFPYDLPGAITDCTTAIDLDPSDKNAFFLRGLARYETGEAELACADFRKAINLGFTILEELERPKCEEYWQ